MHTTIHYLHTIYNDQAINFILEAAINQQFEIYFINELTNIPQPLTLVQLMGLKKFGGIKILLETGQTYQIGLEIEPLTGTYQTLHLADLIVNNATLKNIQKIFGKDK